MELWWKWRFFKNKCFTSLYILLIFLNLETKAQLYQNPDLRQYGSNGLPTEIRIGKGTQK